MSDIEYYSITEYTYDGTTQIFSIGFDYRDESNVIVEVTATDGTVTEYVQDTDYEFLNSSQITLITIPEVDSTIEIHRETKRNAREVAFSTGAIFPHELDNDSDQHFKVSQEAIDLANKSLINSTATAATAEEALTKSEQAIANSAEALSITSNMQESVDSAAVAAQEAAAATAEAISLAENSTHTHINKDSLDLIDCTGGSFKYDDIELARADLGNVDTSVFVGTDGANADAESFRSLVGMSEVESDITGLQTEVASTGSNVAAIVSRVTVLENDDVQALCYAPQTIIAGATGDLPDGWTLEDCDAPAAHIFSSGTSELTILAGLQVAAGYEGQVYVSDALAADTTLDISACTEGTAWIYADVGTDGSLAFGFTEDQPIIGLQYIDSYDSIIPVFSSNMLSGVGTVSASSLYSTTYDVYKAFTQTVDSYSDCWLSANSATTGWLRFVGVSTLDDYVAVGYRIAVYTPGDAPLNWAFIIGSGETPDTTVDSQTSITGWTQGILKTFIFDTPVDGTDIRSFELNIIASQSGAGNMQIGRLELLYAHKSDFYNTAEQSHYDSDGNPIRRVYIGSVDVVDGAIEDITNYQHGTEYTEIINDNEDVTINSIYYPKKRYLGSCYPTARVFVEKHWGRTGFFSYSGFSVGVRVWSTGESLSVHTALAYLTHVQNTALATFTTYVTSAPCKITVKRGY